MEIESHFKAKIKDYLAKKGLGLKLMHIKEFSKTQMNLYLEHQDLLRQN